MHRYALVLEYDGSFFSGWQWQKDAPSVQTTLEKALHDLTKEDVRLYAAGRTDSGVHALGQVVHLDLSRPWSLDSLRRGLNFYLDDIPIKIIHAYVCPPSFHARFSAQFRQYEYLILNRPSPSALIEKRAWWIPVPLDQGAMREGCAHLQGHHDFSYFRHRDCQSPSPFKTLDLLTLENRGELLVVHAKSKSFLHRQVRMMVGALVSLGKRQFGCDHLLRLLNPVDQDPSPPHRATTAPAHGLYLARVGYDFDWSEE